MSNGAFDEIREMITENDIDNSVALRLILRGMVDISDRLNEHNHNCYSPIEHTHPKIEEAIEGLKRWNIGAMLTAISAGVGAILAVLFK